MHNTYSAHNLKYLTLRIVLTNMDNPLPKKVHKKKVIITGKAFKEENGIETRRKLSQVDIFTLYAQFRHLNEPSKQLFDCCSGLNRGVQRGALSLRGVTRGRGRGAAGSRGAGGSRLYVPATQSAGYRRHPAVVRGLYHAIVFLCSCSIFFRYFA